MSKSWQDALEEYSYPVNLKDFRHALTYPAFFNQDITGDRDSTMGFELYFRTHAKSIEPWFEVVFWKLFSQPRVLQKTSEAVISQLTMTPQIKPTDLLEKVEKFMVSESREDFESFRKLFRFRSTAIAIVATFPAFLCPDRFPMVDTRVAKWVNIHYKKFNAANPDAPQLIPSEFGNNSKATVLTMNDFSFYIHWIHWTRYAAEKLSSTTGRSWRPRDVEMAVFTSWGDRNCSHPFIFLSPRFDEDPLAVAEGSA